MAKITLLALLKLGYKAAQDSGLLCKTEPSPRPEPAAPSCAVSPKRPLTVPAKIFLLYMKTLSMLFSINSDADNDSRVFGPLIPKPAPNKAKIHHLVEVLQG